MKDPCRSALPACDASVNRGGDPVPLPQSDSMSPHPQPLPSGRSGWSSGVACRVLVLLALASPTVAFAAPVPKAKPLNKLFVATSDGKAVLLNPDGTDAKSLLELGSPEELITATLGLSFTPCTVIVTWPTSLSSKASKIW